MQKPRFCLICRAEIRQCMGFVLAKDLLSLLKGEIQEHGLREFCGRCNTAAACGDETAIQAFIVLGLKPPKRMV